MPCSSHAFTKRSTKGPRTSTLDAHIRSQSASQAPDHVAACAAHAPLGYTETKHSGKTASVAPRFAASPRRSMTRSIVASASRIAGVACTPATRTVSKAAIGGSVTRHGGDPTDVVGGFAEHRPNGSIVRDTTPRQSHLVGPCVHLDDGGPHGPRRSEHPDDRR